MSAARDGVVRVWNAATGHAQTHYKCANAHTSSAACFAGRGTEAVVSCHGPRGIAVCCPLFPPRPADLRDACHEDAVRGLACVGRQVVSASDDGTLMFWTARLDPDAGTEEDQLSRGQGGETGEGDSASPALPAPVSLATQLLLRGDGGPGPPPLPPPPPLRTGVAPGVRPVAHSGLRHAG